jgi:hypothetical protein
MRRLKSLMTVDVRFEYRCGNEACTDSTLDDVFDLSEYGE